MQESKTPENTDFLVEMKTYLIDLVNNPQVVLSVVKALIFALFIYWIGKKIARWVATFSSRAITRTQQDQILSSFVSKLVYYSLLTFVIIMALTQLGFQTTSLIALVGAAGLAIGLALKDSLANFAAGIMLVMFRPFKIGDFVELTDVSGTVKEIKLFSTYLRTTDNKNLIIPNSQVTNDVITNYSAQPTRRIDLVIGVSYDDDVRTAKKIIEDTITAHEKVLSDPEPKVMLNELGASSVNFTVRPWVESADYWPVRAELLEQLKYNIEAGGCSFPYPQQDVHLYKQAD